MDTNKYEIIVPIRLMHIPRFKHINELTNYAAEQLGKLRSTTLNSQLRDTLTLCQTLFNMIDELALELENYERFIKREMDIKEPLGNGTLINSGVMPNGE